MLPVFLIQLFIFVIAPVVMVIFILYKTFNSKYRMEQIENMGNHADGVIIEKEKISEGDIDLEPLACGYLYTVSFDDFKGERRTGKYLDSDKHRKVEVGDPVHLKYLPYEKKLIIIDWDYCADPIDPLDFINDNEM